MCLIFLKIIFQAIYLSSVPSLALIFTQCTAKQKGKRFQQALLKIPYIALTTTTPQHIHTALSVLCTSISESNFKVFFFLFLLFLNSFGGPIFFHFEFWKTLDHKEPGMVNVKCMAPYGNPTLLDTKVHCCSHSLCVY